MFSIGIVKSGTDLHSYFIDKDNYYLSDKSDIQNASIWYGKGAKLLGIEGQEVETDVFKDLVNGKLPDGTQLGIKKDGKNLHRPATDLTFSAPKSLSIMGLTQGDQRIIEKHNQAVDIAINKVESLYAEARKTENKTTFYEKTDNLIIGRFRHTTSRELDPQLHTHCVVINATQREDGAWRALSSRAKSDLKNIEHGFRENLYQNQHYIGMIYNSELAKGIKELGYDIKITDKHGNFEILGIPKDYLDSQSKRRGDIVKDMNEKGLSGAKNAQKVCLFNRKSKKEVSMDELQSYWTAEAKEKGVDLEQVYKQSLSDKAPKTENNLKVYSDNAKDAIKDAITHLSQYDVQISHSVLIRQAFILGGADINHDELENSIKDAVESGELKGKSDHYYTTDQLVQTEKSLKKQIKKSIGVAYSKIMNTSGLVADTLQHKDRLQVINVKGFKNEADLLNQFVKDSESQDVNVFLVNQSVARSHRLDQVVDRDNSTIWKTFKNYFKHDLMSTTAKFLSDYEDQSKHSFLGDGKEDIVIITDAQKLSYQEAQKIMSVTEKGNAKVLFLNNTESTKGFKAGNFMKLLNEEGVVQHQSITRKKETHINLAQSQTSVADMGKIYAKQPTTVVAHNHKMQSDITKSIREQLQINQKISLQEITYHSLSTKSLSDVEKTKLKFYGKGDMVSFEGQNYLVQGKEKGQLVLSETINFKEGQKVRGKLLFDPQSNLKFEVKKSQPLSISVGEQLRTTRHLYLDDSKIDKNKTFKVTGIHQKGIDIEHQNKTYHLPQEKLKQSFIDHGYVIKPHQLDKDIPHVMTSLSGYQVNQNTIGDIAEYARNITLITDKVDKAKEALNKQKIHWSAEEVSQGEVSHDYNPIVRSDSAIRKDLEVVANALCKGDHMTAESAVSYGLAMVAEKEAAFDKEDLLKEAMRYAIGDCSSTEIENIIKEKEQNGELLCQKDKMTTPFVYKLEKSIIENMNAGKNTLDPIYKKLPELQSQFPLTQGQKDAVSLALTTKDQFISIDGKAGTGKTTMMTVLRDYAHEKGFNIVGIAPTRKAVHELNHSLNEEDKKIPVYTAHQFMGKDQAQFNEKTIFIVDEVSMIGNQLYKSIQEKVINAKGRALFTGDIGQQVSIDSGKPNELCMKQGMRYVTMSEIIRQDNEIMKKSAYLASNKDSGGSLKNLERAIPRDYINRDRTFTPIPHIGVERKHQSIDYQALNSSFIEIGIDTNTFGEQIWVEKIAKDGTELNLPSCENLFDAVANDYLSRDKETRDKTMVVACMHQFRDAIEKRVRSGLKKEGEIKDAVNLIRYVAKNEFNDVQKLHAENFATKDIIVFDKGYGVAKKGDHMQVIDKQIESNTLTLKNLEDGQYYKINPALYGPKTEMSLYEEKHAELGIGDRIRLRNTNDSISWEGGAEYQVSSLQGRKAIIENNKNKLVLNLDNPKEKIWDYAYTHTTYSAQGATEKNVIGVELNDNYRSNYIAVSRAKQHTIIYTLDKEWLINHLTDASKMAKADKTSAFEIMNKTSLNDVKKTNTYQEKTIVKEQPVRADDLRDLLAQRSEELCYNLKGEPNKKLSNKTSLRYGDKGSFVLNTEKGLWYNHESGEKGNAFDLIKTELGLTDFKDVLSYAKSFLNYDATQIVQPKVNHNVKKIAPEIQDKKNQMHQYAQTLYDKSKPIHGTLAEKYLIKERGLHHYNSANVRFLTSISGRDKNTNKKVFTPALLSFATDKKGAINHVQVVRLNDQGQKNKSVSLAKQTYAEIKGRPIELNHQSNKNITYISEGIETGLSILNVKNNAHVLAVLGFSNFKNLDLDTVSNKVVICLDNDFKNKQKLKSLDKKNKHIKQMELKKNTLKEIESHFKNKGKSVRFVLPNENNSDLNDVLNDKGFNELKNQMGHLMQAKDVIKITDKYIHSVRKGMNIDIKELINKVSNSYKINPDKINPHEEKRHIESFKSMTKTQDKELSKMIKNETKTNRNITKEYEKVSEQMKREQIENIANLTQTKSKNVDRELDL